MSFLVRERLVAAYGHGAVDVQRSAVGGLLSVLCRCLYVAAKIKSKSASYMMTGFTGYFAFHFIENMGMAVGLLPITGIPLPFMSLGGTAMLNISINRNM